MKKITLAEVSTIIGMGAAVGVGYLFIATPSISAGIFGFVFGTTVGILICIKRRSMTQTELDKLKARKAKPACPFCNEQFTYIAIHPVNLAKFTVHLFLATFAILKHFPMRWKCASCEKSFDFTRSTGSDSDSE